MLTVSPSERSVAYFLFNIIWSRALETPTNCKMHCFLHSVPQNLLHLDFFFLSDNDFKEHEAGFLFLHIQDSPGKWQNFTVQGSCMKHQQSFCRDAASGVKDLKGLFVFSPFVRVITSTIIFIIHVQVKEWKHVYNHITSLTNFLGNLRSSLR